MDTTFTLNIISPEGVILSKKIQMITLPALEGEMGILKDHAPFISSLKPGFVQIKDEQDQIEQFFVEDGFIETADNHCSLLVEKIEKKSEMNLQEIEQQIKNLTEDLELAQTETEKQHIERQLKINQIKITELNFISKSLH